MSDYIKREDAEKNIDIALERFTVPNGLQDRLHNQIGAVPTADVVEVVRCKDCKYQGTMDCPIDEQYEDDFCSYGEQKESDDNE